MAPEGTRQRNFPQKFLPEALFALRQILIAAQQRLEGPRKGNYLGLFSNSPAVALSQESLVAERKTSGCREQMD
uniref:Uncharacterized protein n=1 Tax=Globodera rostochiensis TaxID=31243 RepID=A0A914I8J9_GLORO